MGKGQRKVDQWRDDSSSSSSSSGAKRRRPRHYQIGDTSRPNVEKPRDAFHDVVIELKDAILNKESSEDKFKRKIDKLKKKRKTDKKNHEEDLRVLREDIETLKEGLRILKESHDDLKSNIQEMQKEGCAEVDHFNKTSTSQRSQLSESTRYRLIIENRICKKNYKNEEVQTEDGGGIKVAMYDGGNRIAPNHSLASVKVELVVIEGRFNNDKRESWSKEEFEKSIIRPREGMVRLVRNGTFQLTGGRFDHQGAIIMDNSQKKEVRLGVMIAVPAEERVIEGVSNLFKVQEVKTKSNGPKKKYTKPSPQIPTQNLVQPTSTHTTQHGQALKGNDQNFLPAHMQLQSASHYPMQNGQLHSWAPPNEMRASGHRRLLVAHGQDQCTTLPNGISEHAYPNSANAFNGIQSTSRPEDLRFSNAQAQMHETWLDKGDLPPKKRRNAKYRLRFDNRLRSDYYIGEKIKSEDGTSIKMALYDENNSVVRSGPLSSALVEVVLLQGDINDEEGQDEWTLEKFSCHTLHKEGKDASGVVKPVVRGDCVVALTNGIADLGNLTIEFPSSLVRAGKFRMGVQITDGIQEGIQEGISSPFVVRGP